MATKGRKKGRNRDRERIATGRAVTTAEASSPDDEGDAGHRQSAAETRRRQAAAVAPRMPSMNARISGAVLSVVTAGLAVYMVVNGIADESTGEGVVRIIIGLVLVVVAFVAGVCSLAPELVLRVFGRRAP